MITRSFITLRSMSVLFAIIFLFSTSDIAFGQEQSGNFDRQLLITLNNSITSGMRAAGSTWKGWNHGGGYRTSTPIKYRVSALTKAFNLQLIDQWPIKVIDVHCIVVSIPQQEDINSTISELSEHPYVESVQLMQLFATQSRGYNDPLIQLQKSVASMDVFSVHQWTQGKGVKVGIVDTGININHPDLKGQIRYHHDFVRQPNDRFTDDEHGTAIAGIIAAIADNDEGIVGVAPQTDIYAFKACWPQPDYKQSVCSSFTLAQALSAAIDNKVDILNLSLAGPKDPLLERIIQIAIDKGVIVVGAVTENILLADQFPGSIPGVIAVQESSSAKRSDNWQMAHNVFVAPGADVLTTTALGKYNYQSGSSLSAAHVSGVAALLKEMQPDLISEQLMTLLDGGDFYKEQVAGSFQIQHQPQQQRRVNACKSLNGLLKSRTCVTSSELDKFEDNRVSKD